MKATIYMLGKGSFAAAGTTGDADQNGVRHSCRLLSNIVYYYSWDGGQLQGGREHFFPNFVKRN